MSVLKSIVGSSHEAVSLRNLIGTIGKSDSTTLILGESGTGKDLTARALHEASSRKNNPFIPVNCGAIPKDLLESELFGHKKGSFTGAISDRKGRFQLAHTGTLFLDDASCKALAVRSLPVPLSPKMSVVESLFPIVSIKLLKETAS